MQQVFNDEKFEMLRENGSIITATTIETKNQYSIEQLKLLDDNYFPESNYCLYHIIIYKLSIFSVTFPLLPPLISSLIAFFFTQYYTTIHWHCFLSEQQMEISLKCSTIKMNQTVI